MNKHETIEGVIPAVLTPFTEEGIIDSGALERQAAYLSEAGVHGFFIAGTTAEGIYLSDEERRQLFEVIRGVSQRRQRLYLVLLGLHTEQVVAQARWSAKLKPDFVAAVPPLYYATSQSAIIEHFRAVAAAAPAPLVLYNIPQNTHNPMTLETILTLAADDSIVGIKDSSGVFEPFTKGLLGTDGGRFAWIQGEDMLDLPSLLLGAPALVTGLGNVWIEPYVAMYEAVRRSDHEGAREHQRTIHRLGEIIAAAGGDGIPAIKSAAARLGRTAARMRIAATTLDKSREDRVAEVLRRLELIA